LDSSVLEYLSPATRKAWGTLMMAETNPS